MWVVHTESDNLLEKSNKVAKYLLIENIVVMAVVDTEILKN